ncbi:MAG TPA: RluA family pseudouridine synthase [Polyangiaceae bacterium]|nr:RluA family pseudouridine synthase [Polyangiaceae bacterium]
MRTPIRWIAREGDGQTVREVLVRAGADALAVREGRVFVGRRRVKRENEPVHAGDLVHVAPPLLDDRPPEPRVLARTDDLVAVDKPAGMPTIADHAGAVHALVSIVARSLGLQPSSVHPTSRLDRDVSGVVVLALSRPAAARLVRARARGEYARRYVAIAARAPEPQRGTWDAPIGRSTNPRLRLIHGRDATTAQTRYAVCAQASHGEAMLALVPVTGRTHQIRVHAANARAPLIGDRAYGGPVRVVLASGAVLEPKRIALHAARVEVPTERSGMLVAVSPVPDELLRLWAALGGDPASWQLSESCAF